MTSRVRVWLAIHVGLLVAFLAIAAWTIVKFDWNVIGRSLAEVPLLAVTAMAMAWLAALCIRPVRLIVLIRAMAPENQRGYWPLWCASMIAMGVNSIVPMRAGDMAMALVLRQSLGIRSGRAFSAMLVDRFFDVATAIVLFVSALLAAPAAASWTTPLVPSLVSALIVLVAGLWMSIRLRHLWLHLLERALAGLGARSRERWQRRAHDLFEGFAAIDKPSTVAAVLALSIILWSATTMSYWFGISAVWPSASVAAAAFAAGAVALSFIVPIAPGGVGVFHGACVLALSLFDVPLEHALAGAIMCHAFQLGSVLILAAVALASQGISLRSLTVAPDMSEPSRG